MCKWGTSKKLRVKTFPSGEYKEKDIDACIWDIVKALNDGGIVTTGSCCGHGRQDGEILLEDGRRLRIIDFKAFKKYLEKELTVMTPEVENAKSPA